MLVAAEQGHELKVNENLVAAHLNLLQHANIAQRLEIGGGGFSLRNARVDEVLDTAIRLHEDQLDQLAAVSLSGALANVRRGMQKKGADGMDLFG